jgi:Fanconi anemia group M protein
MTFVRAPYIKNNVLEERAYQTGIVDTAINNNTLCVLPTGMGKTQIAVLVAAHRLENCPGKKILMMAPTRPLCAQHQEAFREFMDIEEDDVILVTGVIAPEDRMHLYRKANVIVATPQTIQNDIKNGIMGLNDFSLMVFDECHRAVRDYAYTYVAKMYALSKNNLILGLTASPGGDEDKIKQICKNLSIDSVEIRTEEDDDIVKYAKEIDSEYIRVDLQPELKEAQELLKKSLKLGFGGLRKYDINARGKKDLLDAQKKIMKEIETDKKPIYFHLVAEITKCIKVSHLLEMMETQSVKAARKYIKKLRLKKTASDRRALNDLNVLKAIKILDTYESEHPKMLKIAEIMEEQLKENKDVKIIVFSHFRDNIAKMESILNEIEGCRATSLIGQAGEKGLSQKEQINVIKDYEADIYNCLITSPIGEEGLHLASADLAIFYDSVPSEIRTIQRRGRVGRTKIGRIIFLLTRNTRDETYYYVAKRKEETMKTILKDMQNKNNSGLMKFLKK